MEELITYHSRMDKLEKRRMEKDYPCEFFDLCKDCHPETEMAKKRESCNCQTCKKCGIYWAFRDGYLGLDEE